MKKGSILLVSTFFFIFSAWSGPIFANASEAEKVAHELLEVSGVTKMGTQITAQLIKHQRKNMPDIPEQFWVDVAGTLKSDGLNKKIVAVYVRHFSIEEMKTIVAFYKTTVGKKYLQKLPEITQESMAVGRIWNREVGAQIAEKLKTADLKSMKK
ncbi:MAG: DUF2059 domain-containing protein [Nitrospirota bacterium]|nr:DUF2059 domain-containing protein [Nitrospirota bacterium]